MSLLNKSKHYFRFFSINHSNKNIFINILMSVLFRIFLVLNTSLTWQFINRQTKKKKIAYVEMTSFVIDVFFRKKKDIIFDGANINIIMMSI